MSEDVQDTLTTDTHVPFLVICKGDLGTLDGEGMGRKSGGREKSCLWG